MNGCACDPTGWIGVRHLAVRPVMIDLPPMAARRGPRLHGSWTRRREAERDGPEQRSPYATRQQLDPDTRLLDQARTDLDVIRRAKLPPVLPHPAVVTLVARLALTIRTWTDRWNLWPPAAQSVAPHTPSTAPGRYCVDFLLPGQFLCSTLGAFLRPQLVCYLTRTTRVLTTSPPGPCSTSSPPSNINA